MITDLSDKAMLARLKISQWTARRYDKAVSSKVASDYNTDESVGRYNKLLVAEDSIKTISRTAGDARTYHYANTLPWSDDEFRLLPATNYFPYTQALREFETKFSAAVSAFVGVYPTLIEEARARLGGMFRAEDYPDPYTISDKYAFGVEIISLQTANDFRVSLGQTEIAKIKADIEDRTAKATASANRELWSRVYEAVKHMTDKLSEPDAIFRDSLVGNVAELVDLLPRLNVLGDADLESLGQEIEQKLLRSAPEVLREDKDERAAVASDSQSILSAMNAYMAGK